MPMEIAAFVGENGRTSNLYEKGKIVVYQRVQDKWIKVREMEFCLDKTQGIKGMRMQMLEAIGFLNECRSFVARSISGISYLEFEKRGFDTWEYPGYPAEFLDIVIQDQEGEENNKGEEDNPDVPVPVEISPGSFRISIKELQKSLRGLTSKQVLLPLLRKGGFDRLDIVCSHVPPWLEAEFENGLYRGEVKKAPTESIITLLRNGDRSGER